jgi:NADH-quinone oxidoreductase subunit A
MQAYSPSTAILIFLADRDRLSAIIVLARCWCPAAAGSRDDIFATVRFEPFSESRTRFDVRFYLVAILFIIFDLEVAFLFPWAVSLGRSGCSASGR